MVVHFFWGTLYGELGSLPQREVGLGWSVQNSVSNILAINLSWR
jgi:hypothetical protein